MLQTIRLKNFQSHKDTDIEVDKGITVFTGISSAGKTAILRGFSWVHENRPSGNSMISYWNRKTNGSPKNETSVELVFDNGTVKRIKDDATNGYAVNGTMLTTVGTDVPDSVLDVMAMTDLNVAKQLDPHFLLSSSAGEVARYLNKLVNLDKIDEVLSQADSEQRKCRADLETTVENRDTLEKRITELAWVNPASKVLKVLDKSVDALEALMQKVSKLSSLVESAEQAEQTRTKHLYTIISAKRLVEKLDTLSGTFVKVSAEYANLTTSISNLQTVVATALRYDSILHNAQPLVDGLVRSEMLRDSKRSRVLILEQGLMSYIEASKTFDKQGLEKAKVSCDTIINSKTSLEDGRIKTGKLYLLIEQLKDVAKQIKTLPIDLEYAKEELPSVCPTCGGPLKGDVCV